ncbi:hypothetical protein NDU88_001703 [Pleurodeles waltl]|uniref:Uncharacterized protein n=1 Tax=Pleurodeles waltl TaxID=8319 RepID=A0AAV7W0R9_PLEWA|nr:hypothetical protein NDU88_001703 [Pleurodeles waltl]
MVGAAVRFPGHGVHCGPFLRPQSVFFAAARPEAQSWASGLAVFNAQRGCSCGVPANPDPFHLSGALI